MVSLLIDVHSAFFRAFHALPAMSTRAGEPTSALYGFSVLLLKLLRESPGASLAFAVDTPKATFRHELFGDYKGQRDAAPDDLRAQLRRLPPLLEALSVPVIGVPGFEADDVLATLAKRARDGGESVLVVSGDRDLLQLAHGGVRVHFIGRRGEAPTTYDEAAVTERFGLPPSRLPAYVALIGDASDNLPGVPGIGPAAARRLLTRFGSAREMLDHVGEVDTERLRSLLGANAAQIALMEELARLRDDVPLPADCVPVRITTSGLSRLRALFEELEFKSLLPRIDRLIEAA
jgi:DNA polymerase I